MCGRARCTLGHSDFTRACHVNSRPVRHQNMDRYQPSYNVAPGFNLPVVRRDRDDGADSNGVVLHCMKWGLIPSFTKKTEKPDHFRMFNARSESLKEKASFRRLIPNNRCLVAVEGFYEWKKDGSKKQPYYIYFKDSRPLVFAALFDSWKNPEGEVLYTFTIVTTSSSSSLEWLHDRMPVIFGDKESSDRWLTDSSTSNLDEILKPYEEADLAWYPVTPAMGKLSFDGPECIKEIQVKSEETKLISQFFSKKAVGGQQEPKLERTTAKEEEPSGASTPKSVKDEPESPSTSEKARIKDVASPRKCIKDEPGSPSTLEKAGIKDEPAEASPQECIKEGNESLHEYYPSATKKDDIELKTNVSSISPKADSNIPMKRDHEEFSTSGKSLDKKNEKQQKNPVKKRGKGADEKQPTLFSYFGKS